MSSRDLAHTADIALEELAAAVANYDATPRVESRYKPAFERLHEAALSAGMPRYWPAVVEWSRRALQPSADRR